MKENRCEVQSDGSLRCEAYSSYIGDMVYLECDHYESRYFGNFGRCKYVEFPAGKQCECTNEWAAIAKAMEDL